MGRYIDRPEPGRNVQKIQIVERIVEKPTPAVQQPAAINISELANAVANALSGQLHRLPTQQGAKEETFNDEKTLEKLAQSMTVQRGKSESNFNNLGNVNETIRDTKDTNKTIDLLSDLSD